MVTDYLNLNGCGLRLNTLWEIGDLFLLSFGWQNLCELIVCKGFFSDMLFMNFFFEILSFKVSQGIKTLIFSVIIMHILPTFCAPCDFYEKKRFLILSIKSYFGWALDELWMSFWMKFFTSNHFKSNTWTFSFLICEVFKRIFFSWLFRQ